MYPALHELSRKMRFEQKLEESTIGRFLVGLSEKGRIKFSLVIAFLVLVLLIILDITTYTDDLWGNILSELHGMLFDILVIVIGLEWIHSLGERRRRIRRYQEEIDDYLGWKLPEASRRIVGNIRRLNRLGIHKIILDFAFIPGTELANANLEGSSLISADQRKTHLWMATLEGANLSFANLEEASLQATNLSNAILSHANLSGAYYDDYTMWPDDFDFEEAGAIHKFHN